MRITLLMIVDGLALLLTLVVFWLLYLSTAAPDPLREWEEDAYEYDPL